MEAAEKDEELIERDALMRWADEAPSAPQITENEDVLYFANPAHRRRERTRHRRVQLIGRRRHRF